ncbi:MAG: SusC/RagA family TonB-linked outer membrane protein [Chitinophagales bacterium]
MKNKLLHVTGFFIFWLACHQLSAQTRTITGTVKDIQGEPLIGVTVLVKGTTTGTYSDVDGAYALLVPPNAGVLEFKYLGFKTKAIDIGATNVVNVSMEEDVMGLNEVVITALGIPKEKKALGYSTQSVSGDDMNKSGSGNALSELNGKVSGLTIINSAGTPGSGTYVRLRGVTSLTGNNQPLIIVDGIPIDNSVNVYDPTNAGFLATGASGNNTGGVSADNRGTDINPNDIESITVLKGPAATALYGLQAASGAIIITTKRGGGVKKGTNVSFNSSFSADVVNKLPELQTTYGQGLDGTYYGPTAASGNKRFSWGPSIDTLFWDGISNGYDSHGNIVGASDPAAATKVVPYDPLDFFETGSTFNNNLALSGGNEVSGYRLSFGNVKQEGVVPLTSSSKTTISLSGQTNLLPKLKTSAGINYVASGSDKAQNGSNISGVMLGLLRTPATFDNTNGSIDPANDPSSYVFEDGTQRNYRGGPGYDNPYWTINRNPFREDVDRTYGYFQVDYATLSFMSITYRLGGDIYQQRHKNAFDINSNQFNTGLLILDNYHSQQFNSDLIVNFQKSFTKDLNGSLMLGHNYFTAATSQQFTQGTGFSLPTFFDMSNATSYFSAELNTKKRTMAFYGQAQLDYKSMLYLTLTGRNETSSTLPAANNTFFYPSASLSFVFTEAFGLSSNDIFPYGKIRLSYAQVGKDAPVQALNTYYVSTTVLDGFTAGLIYPINGVSGYSLGTVTSVIGNPNLKPEKTNSAEIGVDLGFFKNRVALSATYYEANTSDQIFTVAIPYTTGFASAILNAGEISNKGVELSLNLTPIKNNNGFNWDIGFNWSRNKNRVESLAPGIQNLFLSGFQGGAIYAVAGEPYGIIYGSRYLRSDDGELIINDDQSDPGYGKPIAGTVNGPIGDTNPDWTGSVNNTFSYRGLSFGFQLDIRHGGDIWNGTKGALTYFGTSKESEDRGETATFSGVAGHVDADGNTVHYGSDGTSEEAGEGSAVSIESTLDQYYYQFIGSSFIGPTEPDVEDGSFVRIREMSLTYSLPRRMIEDVHLTQFDITLFENNPFLWTKYTGVDPETSLIGPANGQGLDYFNNPGVKSFGVRLNLGF